MSRVKVTREGFDVWAKVARLLYASESIPVERSGMLRRLRFEVTASGSYVVSLGVNVLYQGVDFDLAASMYNLVMRG